MENFKNNKNIKELPLILSEELFNIIFKIDSVISKDIIELTKSNSMFPYSFADLPKDHDYDYISLLPVNRVSRLDIKDEDLVSPSNDSVVWNERYRQPFRIGVFITRFLPKYAGTKELEKFVNEYKAKLMSNKYEIRLVEGEEIRKWYHVRNYYNPTPWIEDRPDEGEDDPRTTLMKSCLKSNEKQEFFDIYCDNPEQVKMLIMLNEDKKLLARAIVWFGCVVIDKSKRENPDIGVLMDRIYYTNESDVNIFINYAKERGWWYKNLQSKEIYTFVKDGEICDKPITVRIKNNGIYNKYPYIDTMCFYTPETGRLSSHRGIPVMNKMTGKIMDRYELHRANGGTKKLSQNK